MKNYILELVQGNRRKVWIINVCNKLEIDLYKAVKDKEEENIKRR